ncbi:MAG: hypothetical protein QM820_29740 [Minicystis sp.]
MTAPIAEGWRAPSRVMPFHESEPQTPHASPAPVRPTLPNPQPSARLAQEAPRLSPAPMRPTLPDPQPSPRLAWVVLGIALVITSAAGGLIVRALDRPAAETAPPASAQATRVATASNTSEVAPPPVVSASTIPAGSASAPIVPRRPAPAKQRKPQTSREIRDPWGYE